MKKVLVLAVTAMFAIAVSAQNAPATQTAKPADKAAPAKEQKAAPAATPAAKEEKKADKKAAKKGEGKAKGTEKKADNAAKPAEPAKK